ncbi:EamA domain-containing membrane protein RarD [Malonomonas rubra DSM 5091]|uniref:EamA domain-containing membrane protein RarD n=1 Tax=Malonomonas rubra DSM 5091 TaxID=1122189 RepID=A0A1M6EVX4_MALRU|nr:DMT family transporter [Malonomonas rubra]SHI89529.1 EamA domain-containing membrane protein RarD [Malonomonas rubra DSM 5091]
MTTNRFLSLPVIAFCALGVIWGSNFIYMKLAANLISPMQIVFFRVLFGFVPVLIYARWRGVLSWQHSKYIGHFFIMAMLATAVYYYGFAKGTSLLLSGVAGAVSGAIPLFSFLLAVLFLAEERASIIKIAGILVGFIGVVIICRPWEIDVATTNLEGVLYIVAGSLCLGAAFVYAKKFIIPLKIPAAALTTYQLGLGLLALTLVTDYQGISQIFTNPHATLGLIVGLGLLGTGLAYIIYYYIVENLGAVAASSVTYIPPVVALVIGTLLVGEPIGWTDYLATVLIFVGVFLLRRK